ncbi:MAG: hypothetical protein ABH836_01020 [Candidatus Omnitrophota bacterium]
MDKKPELKQSTLGKASTLMGMVGFIATFILVGLAAFLYRREIYEADTAVILLGLFIFADIIFLAAGAGLGLAGIFRTDRKKSLSVFGMILNLSVMAALILLLMVGLNP